MTAAKLLSAVEPVIMYQRRRFRGGETSGPGSPRYDLGLQQKEDVLHRLIDVWATGEASASLGFAAARLFDELDPLEQQKDRIFTEQKLENGRARIKAMGKVHKEAMEWLAVAAHSGPEPESARSPRWKPIPWFDSPCWTPWRAFTVRPANFGTPGTARI
jgi:hypothetical protein